MSQGPGGADPAVAGAGGGGLRGQEDEHEQAHLAGVQGGGLPPPQAGLGFDFPNLPYYEEPGGVRLTQSGAILRHLGRK